MILTEKEAVKKWCPFPGISASPGYTLRKDILDRCIASKCMAWRWRDSAPPTDVEPPVGGFLPRRGFCGLASKPEVS